MLALLLSPMPPYAMARAEGGGSGPVIDPEVQRVMEERGEEQHPLIVAVELSRRPIDLDSLLPTAEEYNTCTDKWLEWEALVDACARDENASQEAIDEAKQAAENFDARVRDKQRAAYANFSQDYADIVDESVPAVLAQLRASFGESVRQVDPHSQLITLRCDAQAFEELRVTPLIRRISYNFPVEPMLDVSRVNIQADRVHNGDGGVGPYTGDGVKVAVVDNGIDYSHPRLPTVESANEKDFTNDNVECQGPGNRCTRGHGTFVAGVLFTQPSPGDDFVGIAYDATVVNAKVVTYWESNCPWFGNCPPAQGCMPYIGETWSLTMEAFDWAVMPNAQEERPEADVVSYSRGLGLFDDGDLEVDTSSSYFGSLNIDWVIYASGASTVHSCGNDGQPVAPAVNTLRPPSGGYNVVSVANYDDTNSTNRSDAVMSSLSSWGPTDDYRRKPDVCAPGTNIYVPNNRWDCANTPDFIEESGTSFAAPHVAGVMALLKEARPSLTPTQVHAILVNSATWMESLDQDDWHVQAGWGMLHAYEAVRQRNYTRDGTLTDGSDSDTHQLGTIPAGAEVVVTGCWHRAMSSETDPVEDGNGNPSPANLDLILESKPSGGSWTQVATTVGTYDGDDGYPEDNVRQIRGQQNPQGQPQLLFRVRVEHNPTADIPYNGSQSYSLASHFPFSAGELNPWSVSNT